MYRQSKAIAEATAAKHNRRVGNNSFWGTNQFSKLLGKRMNHYIAKKAGHTFQFKLNGADIGYELRGMKDEILSASEILISLR